MKPWKTLATDGKFTLRQREREYMVLSEGKIIMSSRQHGAEPQAACPSTVVRGDVASGQGVWIRVDWDRIERSTDGTTWSTGLMSASGLTGAAFGLVP
jgi:hypothetical protein